MLTSSSVSAANRGIEMDLLFLMSNNARALLAASIPEAIKMLWVILNFPCSCPLGSEVLKFFRSKISGRIRMKPDGGGGGIASSPLLVDTFQKVTGGGKTTGVLGKQLESLQGQLG